MNATRPASAAEEPRNNLLLSFAIPLCDPNDPIDVHTERRLTDAEMEAHVAEKVEKRQTAFRQWQEGLARNGGVDRDEKVSFWKQTAAQMILADEPRCCVCHAAG
jgi:hypothetical protein